MKTILGAVSAIALLAAPVATAAQNHVGGGHAGAGGHAFGRAGMARGGFRGAGSFRSGGAFAGGFRHHGGCCVFFLGLGFGPWDWGYPGWWGWYGPWDDPYWYGTYGPPPPPAAGAAAPAPAAPAACGAWTWLPDQKRYEWQAQPCAAAPAPNA
jgi:hypothetical protein